MADALHPDGPAAGGGRVRGWPGPAYADGVPPVLDLEFDAGTLHTARARMRACVSQAGFGDERAEDVILAVHELAANAICHGRGAGRLRVWNLSAALHCQIDDGGPPVSAGPEVTTERTGLDPAEQAVLNSLPSEPGHGLWVVRQVADQVRALSGPAGTSVLIRFDRGTTRHFR